MNIYSQKAQYAKGEQLAGVFIWSVDTDGKWIDMEQSLFFVVVFFL